MPEDAEVKMAGSFQDSLYRNNAKIRKDRADSIIEDANLIYKREIEDLEVEMKKMQREQENMLDLSPTNAMNLTLASDFDSKVYVAKDLELGVKIGFNQSEWIELDDVVVFDEIKTQTSTFNARFDIWVLPFLNVYGIVGQTAKADIDVNLIEPLPLSVTTTLSGTYVGYGVLLAGGIGPLFVSLDANRTYNYNPRLDDPAKVFIGGMRVGPIFRFKNNQDMNVVIWGGAMYSHFNGETNGQINAIDLAPDAPGRIDEMQGDLNNWYDGLSPAEKILYNGIYTNVTDGLTNIKDGVETGYIRYSMNKEVPKPLNMLLGVQWQIDYRWQVRAEAQLLGSRTAGMISVNYRFGVKGKNWLQGI